MPNVGGTGENFFSSSQTSQSSTKPWSGVRGPLKRGIRQAESQVLNQPLEFFPNETFTPFAPETELALAAQTGRALFGNPLNPMAQGQVGDTLAGSYLGQGPGWDQITDAVTSAVIPAADSAFGAGRRFGSPLHAEAVARGTSRGLAPFLDAERGRMMQASAMAPSLAREDYYDMDRLGTVGARQEDLYGRALQSQVDRFTFDQDEPYTRISRFMNLIQPGLGFSTTSGKQVYNPNVPLTMHGMMMDAGQTFGPMAMGAAKSSRAFKTDNRECEPLLEKVGKLDVERWRYKPLHGGGPEHIGPYAEDFKEVFGLGDGVTISYTDAIGICLKAIQELQAEVKSLKERNHA